MLTILSPIDFSNTSNNAMQYTIEFAKHYKDVKIVFYHSCFFHDMEDNREEMLLSINETFDTLLTKYADGSPINYEWVLNDGLLLESIQQLIEQHTPDFIMMGITGKSKFAQKIIGSNTLAVAKNLNVPTLIINDHNQFVPITNVGFALPFDQEAIHHIPYLQMRKVVTLLQAKVEVVNVEDLDWDKPHVPSAVQNAVRLMFDGLDPKFYIYQSNDVLVSINRFLEESNTQIICTVAEERSLWSTLFHKSITDALAFDSPVPLLIFQKENQK